MASKKQMKAFEDGKQWEYLNHERDKLIQLREKEASEAVYCLLDNEIDKMTDEISDLNAKYQKK